MLPNLQMPRRLPKLDLSIVPPPASQPIDEQVPQAPTTAKKTRTQSSPATARRPYNLLPRLPMLSPPAYGKFFNWVSQSAGNSPTRSQRAPLEQPPPAADAAVLPAISLPPPRVRQRKLLTLSTLRTLDFKFKAISKVRLEGVASPRLYTLDTPHIIAVLRERAEHNEWGSCEPYAHSFAAEVDIFTLLALAQNFDGLADAPLEFFQHFAVIGQWHKENLMHLACLCRQQRFGATPRDNAARLFGQSLQPALLLQRNAEISDEVEELSFAQLLDAIAAKYSGHVQVWSRTLLFSSIVVWQTLLRMQEVGPLGLALLALLKRDDPDPFVICQRPDKAQLFDARRFARLYSRELNEIRDDLQKHVERMADDYAQALSFRTQAEASFRRVQDRSMLLSGEDELTQLLPPERILGRWAMHIGHLQNLSSEVAVSIGLFSRFDKAL